MAFSKLTDHIDELGDHLEAYVKSMVEYYKLSLFKKLMKAFSSLAKLLIVGSMFLVFLGFVSVACAILIGSSIGSYSGGFFIVGGFYLLVFFVLLIFWKKLIEGIFLDKFSRFVFNEHESELEEDLKDIKNDVVEKGANMKEQNQDSIKEKDTSWRTEF